MEIGTLAVKAVVRDLPLSNFHMAPEVVRNLTTMNAYRHSLRLVAKTITVVNELGQPQWDLHCSSSWTQVVTEFHLIDPWNPEDENQCRWYLEKHLRKDPFAITKARQTEASLAQYGRNL
jgi:hypothetical protein